MWKIIDVEDVEQVDALIVVGDQATFNVHPSGRQLAGKLGKQVNLHDSRAELIQCVNRCPNNQYKLGAPTPGQENNCDGDVLPLIVEATSEEATKTITITTAPEIEIIEESSQGYLVVLLQIPFLQNILLTCHDLSIPLSTTSMDISTKPIAQKFSWPSTSSIQQDFSYPSSIIYYVARNPSNPKMYLKMVKSCKYFFEKMPLIVVSRICKERIFCSNDEFKCPKNGNKCCRIIDMDKLKSKIWLTNKVHRFGKNITKIFASMLKKKIYRCENAVLELNRTEINIDDFQLLATPFKNFDLMDGHIIYENGNFVKLDKIIEAIPHVEKFEYFFDDHISVATSSTLNMITKLSNLGNLKVLELWNIPETFTIENISSFIENNHKTLKIAFDFDENLTEEYKKQLDQLIDKILVDNIQQCIITYPYQNELKLRELEYRCSF